MKTAVPIKADRQLDRFMRVRGLNAFSFPGGIVAVIGSSLAIERIRTRPQQGVFHLPTSNDHTRFVMARSATGDRLHEKTYVRGARAATMGGWQAPLA
jgi:hypothetical protein